MGGTSLQDALERVEKIAATVRDGAAESERLGQLAPPVFDALQEANLFRCLVPVDRGGLGLTTPEAIAVIGKVSAHDASTGWTLGILSDGAIFARFLPSDTYAALMDDPAMLMCGTLNPMGARAEIVDDGFLFSGRATYLSGSAHSNWTMATAIVTRDGEPVIDQNGLGIAIRAGMFPTAKARCLDTWHVTGMRATGSSDYIWERGVAREPFDNDVLARHRLGYVTAVRLSAQAIDLLHDAAGMSAVASDSVLDRCWRDVHTMTQHIVLSPARFEIAGRVLMGLDPQSPVI